MHRVLLVEDDPTSRSFLLAATAALPAQVDMAGSVEAAYARVSVNVYDAWLIDANLPDGTGAALLARLRAAGHDTPAIAHTAARERCALDTLRAEGFTIVLGKPVSAEAWQSAIRRVLVRHSTAHGRVPPPPRSDTRHRGEAPLWNDAIALAAVGGDDRNVRGLRELFIGELDSMRARIGMAAAASDVTLVCGALHRLHASCGFVGAERLGLAARALHGEPGSGDALHSFLEVLDATRASAVDA